MNAINALETLSLRITKTMDYTAIMSEIQTLIKEIHNRELAKLLELGEKFDVDHMSYDVLVKRGHVEKPTDYHKYLSEFSQCNLTSSEVFSLMDSVHKEQILVDVVKDKTINEQLVAYRHNFEYISHNKGHDGITPEGKVYEVKNHQYKRPKNDGRFSISLKFDRLSENNLRKLDEGRPTIILNSTENHKLLIEMKLDFTDRLVEVYKQKLAGVKGKDTSGTSISFSDYSHAIREITYLSPDFDKYNFSLDLLRLLNDKEGTQFNSDRKSNMCPNVKNILEVKADYIIEQHRLKTPMAKIARELSSDKAKVTALHIKKVLTSNN